MWCRVLLFVIALTCTFQREITADIYDVLCVVILSGLQKEDLDENLLAKLQRHNVNIDDINNRKTIDKCIKRSHSDKSEENGSAKQIVPTNGEQSEQTHVNYNINKTTQVEKISIENENKTNFSTSVENNAYVESHTIPSYENFIKLWAALNNTSHQSNEVKLTKETEKGMIVQLPFSFEKETKIDSNATGLNFINKMFESYISATKAVTTTIKPTTANYQQQNKVDIVSQQIMNMLNNNYGNNNKTFVDRKSEEIKSHQTSTSKINDYVSEAVHIKEQSMDNEERTILKPSEIDNSISRNTTQKPNFKNLVNLWIQLNKTNHQDKKIKEIEKSVTVRATFDQVTKTSSQAKDFDLINKILRSYFSQEAVTTIKPTTPEKEIDILPQIIKKFLTNHSIHYNTTLGDRTLDETFKNRNADINYFRDEKLLKSNETGPLVQHFENLKKLENNLRIDKTRSSLNKHMPIHLNENTNADSQLKYIEMLKDYIAAKYMQTSTQLPTTTPKLIDVILQKINDFFRNNYIDDQKVTVNGASEPLGNRDLNTLKTHHNNDQDWLTHRSVSMQSNNELHDQYQSTIPRPYETKTKDKQSNNLQIVQANDEVRSQKMPITVNNESKNDCHSKELDHIFHMFENYIATKDAETTISVPTLTPTHFDVIAQKLKEYLDSNDNKYRRIMVTQVHAQNQSAKVPQVHDGKLLVNRKIDYMKETQRQANQLNIDDSLDISSKKLGQSNNSQTVQYKLLKVNMLNDTTNPEAKLLSEDVIREITEKVKASVLKDLQKQMFTTLRSVTKDTTKVTTTTKTVDNIYSTATSLDKLVQRFKKESGVETKTELPSTTTTTLRIDQNKIKTATSALENFIDLFEQFKHLRNSVSTSNDLKHTLIQKGKTKNEFHGPINVVYPSLLPPNYPYNVNNTEAVTPMFVNPYGIHINNPTLQKARITNEIQKFQYILDSQHNMENKMKHAVYASVIQTDDAQVPLLGIPVSKSVSPINQNIIVTTKHPMVQFREDQEHRSTAILQKPTHQDYTMRGYGNNDDDSDRLSKIDLGKHSDIDVERYYNDDMTKYYSDIERAYGRGRYFIPNYKKRLEKDRLSSRSKQASLGTDHFYQEYLSDIKTKSDKPWNGPEYLQERKSERFHEKLERPHEWKYRFRDREIPKADKRLNVTSRQQLLMSDLKKKKRYNDSHYLNFLKSQQKVNDMLEKMLKPNNRVRSVEAI